jgi:hypothetical protein
MCEVLAHFKYLFDEQISSVLSIFAHEIKAYSLYYASLSAAYLIYQGKL